MRVIRPRLLVFLHVSAAVFLAACNTVADNTVGITGVISVCDRGLSGVTLTLSTERYDDITAVTDSDGRYYFNEVPDGPYTVTPALEGYTFMPPAREIAVAGDDAPGQDYTAVVTWSRSYGRDSNSGITASDCKIFSMVQTDECGSVVTGLKNVAEEGEQDDFDLWVMKIDLYGDVQWSETYGGSGYDAGHSIVKASNGGFIIAGESSTGSAGLSDFWAVRIDDGGGLVWDYRYGGPEDDSAEGVIETADGEYLLCGYTKSYGSGGYDFGMLRLTGETAAGPSGESFTWWGYSDTDEFSYDFTMKDANGFVFAGDQMFTETVTDESGSYTVTSRHAKVVSFIGGLDNEDFEKTLRAGSTETFEGMPWNELRSIRNTFDGGYICAGWAGTEGSGNMNYWLLKLKPDGDREWELMLDRGLSDRAYTAIQTTDGGYVTAGYTYSSESGGSDFWIVRLNAAGEYLWESIFNGSEGSIDEARAIDQTWDGGFFFAGNSMSVDNRDNIWIMKVDRDGEIPVQWTGE